MADVHVGESVAVRVTTINKTIDGKIALFSGEIDPETRTMHTEVNVSNSNFEIVPGMYATVQIPLHTVQNVLTIPIQAVQSSGEDHGTVLVVDSGNRLERRDVKLGLTSARDIEVLSGLAESERIVFGEQSQFKPGELVKPKFVTPAESE